MKRALSGKKKRNAVIAVALASTGLFGGQKAYELAEDPQGEKDCARAVSPADSARQEAPAQAQTEGASVAPTTLNWLRKGGTINDASCLNRTAVYGVVQITEEEEVKRALAYATANKLNVSIAGVRHSMGGHAFYKDAVVLDMTRFNKMSLDEENKVLTVQSGATWHDIQNFLHPKYAVKAMQSTDIFTVGGSISVNAHGMDHQVGALGKTVRSMRLMLPDGSIQRLSRSENRELFDLVVGGYGLFGIILDVELDITDNVLYATERQIIDYKAFPELFERDLANDKSLGLMYGHLSTAPQSFLQEMILYTYHEVESADVEIPPLTEVSNTKLRRFVINFSKHGSIPMRIKWFAEKYLEPRFESCIVSRNQAMKDGEACLVSRNAPMHDSVKYLKNNLQGETDILQEYFIPRDRFVAFVDGLRQIMTENETKLLNASVRVVHEEDNFLNYAPADMFAVVLYINQPATEEGNRRMATQTQQTVELALGLEGTFFLPYQLYYSSDQLRRGYPQAADFFQAKRRYDPQLVLTNTFYETFAKDFEGQ